MSQYKKKDNILTAILVFIIVGFALVMSFVLPPVKQEGKTEYPLEYDSNFIAACLDTGSSVYGCVCPLAYVKDNYSYQEALGIDKQVESTDKLPDELQRVFDECKSDSR